MESSCFSPGSSVEVLSEEGASIQATILEQPARNPKSQEIIQHDAYVLKHERKAKRKQRETLVGHSKDHTTGNYAGPAKKQCEVRGRKDENGCTRDIDHEEFAPESMLLFSSMVERTSKLQLDDSSGYIDDILGTLAALEKQGFEVKALENRLNQVKSLKLMLEDFKNKLNVVESNITKANQEVDEVSETISVMDIKLSFLKEQRRVFEEKKAKAICETSSLQSEANTLKKKYESVVNDYVKRWNG